MVSEGLFVYTADKVKNTAFEICVPKAVTLFIVYS